jgi:hypothetical protein
MEVPKEKEVINTHFSKECGKYLQSLTWVVGKEELGKNI